MGKRYRDARFLDPESGGERRLWAVLGGAHHTLLLFEENAGALPLGRLADGRDEGLVPMRLDRVLGPAALDTLVPRATAGWS